MSDELVPVADTGATQLQSWQEPRMAAPPPTRSPLERPVAALRRYKWLALITAVLGAAGGVAATRFVEPIYEVNATIVIASDGPLDNRQGPIRGVGLLTLDDWISLLKSFRISDAVARKLALYLQPEQRADAWLFRGFTVADAYVPGRYELQIDKPRRRWTIALQTGAPVDSGAAADSLGDRLGFKWALPPAAFNGTGQLRVKFVVSTIREAASAMNERLRPDRRPQSNFMTLTFEDRDRAMAAAVVNTWAREFVTVAAELKRAKLSTFANTLQGQLATSKSSLDSAESALQTFRVETIREPHEGGPIAAGIAQTTDPVLQDFYQRNLQYNNVKDDIQHLEGLIRSVAHDSIPADAILQVPSVGQAGSALREAIQAYHAAEANLAGYRATFTDEHPDVKKTLAQMATLKQQKIPQYANEILSVLRSREADDSVRIASAGENIQKIPERTIEEEKRRRTREIAAALYTNLEARFAEAQLAEASASPDLTLLDTAIAPLLPAKNMASKLILVGIAGGLGAAIALAILLDKLDGRLRYPDQATDELGLTIAGTVPRFPKRGVNHDSPEQMYQLVESFRSLRMAVVNAAGAGPGVAVAVSSPTPSEGKSLISANLAMSFADAGLRTILVDGDTRRGALNTVFGLPAGPGLTEYLSGRASLNDVVRQGSHEKLFVIPCGGRLRRSPELLTSPRLTSLVSQLRSMYEVVIFDTPPLAAGVDGYSIATATGSLIVVLRIGQTQRRMAAEKLRLFDRLPVDIIGAVLNGINLQGGYEYYGYIAGYDAKDEAPGAPGTAVVESTR